MRKRLKPLEARDVHIVALIVGFVVTDDKAVAEWDKYQLKAVIKWMGKCQASASDNIVWRKSLIQPEFSKFIIRSEKWGDDKDPDVQAWKDRVDKMFPIEEAEAR